MKLQKISIILILTILFMQASFAQEYTIPNDVKLEAAQDYVNSETDILNCINWLENTPMNQDSEKRKMANAFLLRWATGTPTVTIEMQAFQLDLSKKNADLIMNFMGGWIKHAIENPSEKDNTQASNLAGIKSLIKVYAANKAHGMKKDKRIEKLLKLDESELQNWVAKKLK